MRHRVYGKHLGRDKNQRKGLFKGLVYSLLSLGTIQTSEIKAKAIKGLVDKIINSAKENSKFPKQLVQSFVSDKGLQKRLMDDILPKLGSRTSGYTKVTRMGARLGDQSMMVRMSLIGAEEMKPLEKESRIKNLESSKEIKQADKISDKKAPEIKVKSKQSVVKKKLVKRESKKA